MTSSTTGEIGVRSHGWSPELLTLLGAVLTIGVGLAGLMFNFQGQVRGELMAVEMRIIKDLDRREARIREDMRTGEARIREYMRRGETRIREDVRELRGDVGEFRERVSHIEGRFIPKDTPALRPGEVPGATSS